MVVSVGKSVLVFSVLVCFGYSDGHQEVIQTAAAAERKDINHGCPSWFVPISNNSNRCECGKPIHHPARLVYCNPYTNQTQVLLGHCFYDGMDTHINTIEHNDAVYCVAAHPSSPHIILTASEDGTVHIVDTRLPARREPTYLSCFKSHTCSANVLSLVSRGVTHCTNPLDLLLDE